MRTLKILTVSAVAFLVTLGIPTHVLATPAARALEARAQIATSVAPGGTADRTLGLPWHANLVGVSFRGADPEASGVEIELRALRGGVWTAPFDLHVDPDEGPDPAEARTASARRATLPQWIGRAKRVRVVVTLAPDAAPIEDVRLDASNTVGNAFDVPAPLAMLRAVGRFLTAPGLVGGRPAEANPSTPTIIPRSTWNGGECDRSSGPGSADELHLAVVHHTVNSNSYAKSESASLVLGICRYHTSNLGYSDIAYNFLIDKYGQIFEGRYGGVDKAVIGAHTGGFNTGTTGIALIGTYSTTTPPAAMVDALETLLAWKLDVHHVPPTGKVKMISAGGSKYDKGQAVWLNRISGHRDASSTSCPGTKTYGLLPSIRTAVNGMGHPKIYLPDPTHAEDIDFTGTDADGPFTVSPSFSRTVDWTFKITGPDGAVVYSRTGSGTAMSRTWTGRGTDGLLVASGSYDWTITAKNTSGHPATPATGTLEVDADFLPPFFDDDGYWQEPFINAIFDEGITSGCGPQIFCPARLVTRGEVAVFLVNSLGLATALEPDFFSDDDGSWQEPFINAIAAAGITSGCGDGTYCPGGTLTRQQMAVFLVNGFDLPPTETDYFVDDEASFAEAEINALKEAGVTSGCGPEKFCPNRTVTRAEMAVFLSNALGLIE